MKLVQVAWADKTDFRIPDYDFFREPLNDYKLQIQLSQLPGNCATNGLVKGVHLCAQVRNRIEIIPVYQGDPLEDLRLWLPDEFIENLFQFWRNHMREVNSWK